MKIAAILQQGSPHHLDHLIPVCNLMQAPILVTDKESFKLAKKFYPDERIILTDDEEVEFPHKYEAIIHSFFYKKSFFDITGIRGVFVPHGNSDKGHHSILMEEFANQDISLIYGRKMRDFLKEKKVDTSRCIEIGNLRYEYYFGRKAFYDEIVEREIFSKLSSAKETILYAPTWQDWENSSSFFQTHEKLLTLLPTKFNLIIKIHPWTMHYFPGQILHLLERQEKDVLFLVDFPPIYPLLNRTDIYLGDYSSIGYDFLLFNRPLFFIDPLKRKKRDKGRFLHRCGIEVDNLDKIIQIIEEGKTKDFSSIRKKTYEYTFGSNRSGR